MIKGVGISLVYVIGILHAVLWLFALRLLLLSETIPVISDLSFIYKILTVGLLCIILITFITAPLVRKLCMKLV